MNSGMNNITFHCSLITCSVNQELVSRKRFLCFKNVEKGNLRMDCTTNTMNVSVEQTRMCPKYTLVPLALSFSMSVSGL